jgi:endonuclease/exonuclease/phosphatase family metal-dependent hydrolase
VKPDGSIFADRNLVILSRWPIAVSDSIFYKYVQPPEYLPATAVPRPNAAVPQHGDRPVLYAKVKLTNALFVHVVNVHLKSKIPTTIDGQAVPGTSKWNTVPGWAEGSFLSSMKRVGQALDTRRFIDTLFDVEPNAWVAVCGDFNADTDDVPVQAIRGEVEDTLNADLAPRVIVPCERTVPESSRFSLLHRGKGCMFDHMLVSRPMLAFYRGTEIHTESLRDESIHLQVYVANPGSDHAPVVAGFELP